MANSSIKQSKQDYNNDPYYLASRYLKLKEQVLPTIIGILFMIGGLIFLFLVLVKPDLEKGVQKDNIKNSLSIVIKNGASLDVVKHVYDDRSIERPGPFKIKDRNNYYSEETPLSYILDDLRVDCLSSENAPLDSTYYLLLSTIIEDNLAYNPFDNLEEVQSLYFKNLKEKIGDEYYSVQEEVNHIAAELNNRNQLVNKYLNKSNNSFIISIIALILSVGFSIIQFFQGRATKQQLQSIEVKIKEVEEACKKNIGKAKKSK